MKGDKVARILKRGSSRWKILSRGKDRPEERVLSAGERDGNDDEYCMRGI